MAPPAPPPPTPPPRPPGDGPTSSSRHVVIVPSMDPGDDIIDVLYRYRDLAHLSRSGPIHQPHQAYYPYHHQQVRT